MGLCIICFCAQPVTGWKRKAYTAQSSVSHDQAVIQLCSKYLPWTIWCHAVCCLHMVSHCGNTLFSFPVWSSQSKSICPHLARHRETACLKDEEVTALYLQLWKRWQAFWLTTQQEIPHTISRGPQKPAWIWRNGRTLVISFKNIHDTLYKQTRTHAHYTHIDTKDRLHSSLYESTEDKDLHSVYNQVMPVTIGTCCLHISP